MITCVDENRKFIGSLMNHGPLRPGMSRFRLIDFSDDCTPIHVPIRTIRWNYRIDELTLSRKYHEFNRRFLASEIYAALSEQGHFRDAPEPAVVWLERRAEDFSYVLRAETQAIELDPVTSELVFDMKDFEPV